MAGIDEFQMAFLIEDAEEHSGVAADLGVIAEEAIDMIEDARGIDAESHSGKRALKHGGENRGAKSFTGNIGNKKRGAAIAEWKNVEVVSADCQAREVESGNREMRVFAEIAREKRLLNVAGNVDLLLEALAFALAFDEASVIENVGGVAGESIQDLTVELGEGRGAPRIQVKDSEEITALDVDHGFLRIGAGHPEKRNHDHGAQALGNDALGRLQVHVSLREVFRNHRGLLFQRELDGGLAGRKAFGRKAKTPAAPCEFHSKRADGVGFEKQAAVGIGYGDRVIQHVAQHDVERQLGMQQRSCFEQPLELGQTTATAARRLRAGYVLHAREELRKRIGVRTLAGAEDDLVRVLEAEGDRVAVLQFAAFDFFAVDEQAAT